MSCAASQTNIQSKIWRGYGISARKLGSEHQFYRPRPSALSLEAGGKLLLEDGGALALEGPGMFPGDPLFTRHVSLNAEDMTYRRPNKYGKPTWYALVDGHGLKAGDYFFGLTSDGKILLEDGTGLDLEDGTSLDLQGATQGIYFIAALQPLLPILVVECNRIVSIFRPQTQTGVGQQGYGGTTAANEVAIANGLPCSILQGTKGEKSETNLPGDTRSAWWTILMPSSVGRVIADDIMVDDRGLRYILSSVEETDLGYRMTAMSGIT